MRLIEQVALLCQRLVPLGWGPLLERHGLRLNYATLHNPHKLAAELNKSIKIDRNMPGFEDFWPDGERAVERGRPSRSLLYHAFASPLVHPASAQKPRPTFYPTLRELDALENYIYSRSSVSLHDLRRAMPLGSRLVAAVLAYQYRIGARSPNGRFASTALSRTGVSRVGTREAYYDPIRRSFWPLPRNSSRGIAVLPARFAAYLCELRTPGANDAILDEQPGDEDRNFLFPVHKLFDGDECLKGSLISVKYSERHVNEKIRKFHVNSGVNAISGFDINSSPFVRDSKYDNDLATLRAAGSSVLVQPIPHERLTRVALQKNKLTGDREIVRFVVPPRFGDNRYAGSSFQFLDATHAERRTAPEYANIRHLVTDPLNPKTIQDLNDLPWKEFDRKVRRGRYEAAHFVDDSCEGCVSANVAGIDMGDPNKTNFSAFSMICAPDFFPLVDQADVTDWVQEVLGVGGEREQFAQGGPWPLSGRRNCVNPKLLRPDIPSAFAFPIRDDAFARIENITAIVGGKIRGGIEHRPKKDRRFVDPSTSFLPDCASGIFDPGWDVSFSGDGQADFLASYGLGSPFPEDVKLCSALNSFWPSAAPDATRTFGLFPPTWNATTSVPLMDEELGFHPDHPDVRNEDRKSSLGWDGEYGPYFEPGFGAVNHAHIDQSDYVSNALAGEISLARLARIDAPEMFRRMSAIRACIAVLPEKPQRVSSTKLVLVTAERVDDWSKRPDRGDPRLRGKGFLFVLARLEKIGTPAREHGRWRRKVKKRYTCQLDNSGICWRLEDSGERFLYEAWQG